MAITIDGTGSISGISAGGLPDSSVVTADIADANITAAKLDGAQTGDAPIYGCRAWVNFDGTKDTTGATSTANTNRLIRASGNVTSVLRNGTGDYTITFTTAMPDANYAVSGNAMRGDLSTGPGGVSLVVVGVRNNTTYSNAYTTSSVRIFTILSDNAATVFDPFAVNLTIFR